MKEDWLGREDQAGWKVATLQRLGLLFAALEPAMDLLVPDSRRLSDNAMCKSLREVGAHTEERGGRGGKGGCHSRRR